MVKTERLFSNSYLSFIAIQNMYELHISSYVINIVTDTFKVNTDKTEYVFVFKKFMFAVSDIIFEEISVLYTMRIAAVFRRKLCLLHYSATVDTCSSVLLMRLNKRDINILHS